MQTTHERVWLRHYPTGVPADIDVNSIPNVTQLLEAAMQRHAARPAFICTGNTLSYEALDRRSRDLAAWLQASGCAPGTRVAVMLPNLLHYPIALTAILRAGCIAVTINPLYTPRELGHQLRDSGARVIVILDALLGTLGKALEGTTIKQVLVASVADQPLLCAIGDVATPTDASPPEWPAMPGVSTCGFVQTLAEGSRLGLLAPALDPETPALLQYTGGTTGVSKGATLLHRNVIANVLQNEAWMKPALDRKPAEQLRYVCALPLYHIFAMTVCFLTGMRLGACNLLIPNPRDVPALVKQLASFRVSVFPAVNTLFNALAHDPDFARLDFSQLALCFGGGTAVQKPVAEKWVAITGCAIIEGYGLSETAPTATCNATLNKTFSGNVGLPVPSTDISIRDDEGHALPAGQAGEVCIRCPQVMAGYWNRPEDTAQVMTSDGFFRSGDIGVMDAQGYLRIVDRKKDMVLVSGFNVFPNEIEEVAARHPGVLESAAIGVPDERSGEAVKLFVVRRDPAMDESTLRDFLATQLTGYKRPRYIEFRSELPKSAVGKILRRELRARAQP